MCVCSGASWALALSPVNSREEGKLQAERAGLGIPRSTRTRYDAVSEDLVVKGGRLHTVSIFYDLVSIVRVEVVCTLFCWKFGLRESWREV